jgi:hypothetical protein
MSKIRESLWFFIIPAFVTKRYHSLDAHNAKFRKFVGRDAKAETMEQDLEHILMCVHRCTNP